MFITINEKSYELSTKLGTAMALEKRFHMPVFQIFDKLGAAEIPELLDMLTIASGKDADALRQNLIDNWDYIDLQKAVQELIARLLFSGSPAVVEEKVNKFPVTEQQKNAIRELLGIPTVPVELTGSSSSQQDIESE